jgi:predicted DNA-binding mobile mystery protein A
MKNLARKHLMLQQIDKKLESFSKISDSTIPPKGWVNAIRTALGMTMQQLANRLGKKVQNVQAFEKNEAEGKITIQSLKEIAGALDMRLVYGIVPKDGTLEDMVGRKAEAWAKEIVDRTNTTMSLEDQANTEKRLKEAWVSKSNELKNEIPKFLWD